MLNCHRVPIQKMLPIHQKTARNLVLPNFTCLIIFISGSFLWILATCKNLLEHPASVAELVSIASGTTFCTGGTAGAGVLAGWRWLQNDEKYDQNISKRQLALRYNFNIFELSYISSIWMLVSCCFQSFAALLPS